MHNQEAGDAPNDIEKYASVAENKAEVLQFTANDSFVKKGMQFKDTSFKLKKNIIVASIIRDGEVIIPDGSTCINPGDKVIIVSEKKNRIENLNSIFA